MAEEHSDSYVFIDGMKRKLAKAAMLQRCLDKIRDNIVLSPDRKIDVAITINGHSINFSDNKDISEILQLIEHLAAKRITEDLQAVSKDILKEWSDIDIEEELDGRTLERQEVRRSDME